MKDSTAQLVSVGINAALVLLAKGMEMLNAVNQSRASDDEGQAVLAQLRQTHQEVRDRVGAEIAARPDEPDTHPETDPDGNVVNTKPQAPQQPK